MNTDFLTIYWREMVRFFRFKTSLLSQLVQPVIWMLFFGIAMASNFDSMTVQTAQMNGTVHIDYLTFMCAGIIAMTALFTNLFGGFSLLFDKNWGLMREIIASPLKRGHIIVGIGLSGVTRTWIQASIILVFGLIMGVRFFPGKNVYDIAVSYVGILIFVALFSLGFVFLSSAIAVSMESPEGMQGIITLLTMPLFFASNALYPVDKFPAILKLLSEVNPLTHLVVGIRYFAVGDEFTALGTCYAFSSEQIIISAFVLVIFAVLMFILAEWRFSKVVIT